MRTAKTQPTDWVLAPTQHHHLANNKRQQRVYFHGEFLCPFHFEWMFYSYISKNFRVIDNGPPTRTAETQPTDRVLPPAPHPHLANDKRPQWVYFCGEFRCPLHFVWMFYSYISKKIELSAMVLPWEGQKLSSQTEFCLPPYITNLPTSIGRDGYILLWVLVFFQFCMNVL